MECKVKVYWCDWLPKGDRRLTASIDPLNNFKDYINRVDVTNQTNENPNEVIAVSVQYCENLFKIPRNLSDFFVNIKSFDITGCGLKKISRRDLKGLKMLTEIAIIEMDIEKLPGDLFRDLINLEVIELPNNKIKFIGKKIFKHLKKLKFVDLSNNPSIDVVFAGDYLNNIDQYPSKVKVHSLDELNAILDKTYKDELEKPSKLFSQLKKVFKHKEFKDFTIKIGQNDFKVHKLVLAARSPTLAEMIKNNPDADELILEDIEVDVFKIILDYIYEDNVPEEYDDKSMKIFIAASKLKMEPLSKYVGAIISDSIGPDNCIDILIKTSKLKHEELQNKAFEEVKKLFPDKKFEKSLINDAEKLRKLQRIRRALEML